MWYPQGLLHPLSWQIRILFNKGALPIYDVPITWFEINSEQIGMEEGTMTTYICYYAFIIPEDKIYVIEE